MVDISVEILASSVEMTGGNISRYRVKTWWAHIDVPPCVTFIKLPRLPMIQQYLVMTGKDTTMFVETWQDDIRNLGCQNLSPPTKGSSASSRSRRMNDDGGGGGGDGLDDDVVVLPQKRRFIGMTTCCVDEQLKNPNLNPSVQWLDVHDPVEDVVRGRLLLKVDARFAMPNSSTNGNKGVEVDYEPELPVKVILSPRRNYHHNNHHPSYGDEDHSPAKSSQSKSDTSLFSTGSSRSQEQGIQTDLSLPVMSSLYKYNSVTAPEREEQPNSRNGFLRRQNSKSISSTSTTAMMDPLRYAEDILLRHSAANSQRKGSEPPVLNKPPIPTSSSTLRKMCLIKQNQQQSMRICDSQSPTVEERRYGQHSQDVDLDNVGDVIDILNDGVGSGLSPPSKITTGGRGQDQGSGSIQSRDLQKSSENGKGSPNSAFSRNIRKDSGSNQNRNVRYGLDGSGDMQKGNATAPADHGSPSNHKNSESSTNNHSNGHGVSRFKEVHFDGALAKQQATDMLMTVNTSSSSSRPPVPRRRIAAAIFND